MTNDGRLSEDESDHKATLWYDLEKETDILDALFIFYIVVFFTTILVLW